MNIFPFSEINRKKTNWPVIMADRRERAKDPRLKGFYSAFAMEEHHTLDLVHFVALDFETTGLNPLIDDVISIGLVPFDLRRVYCSGGEHWLINPRQQLEEQSVVVHGITHSEIREAPDLQHILGEVLTCLSGRMIVVHYNRIEREFLDRALKARLNEGILFPVIDTMAIEANRNGISNFWRRLKGEKPVSLRLSSSRARYGLPRHQAHHALADAIATAELFQAQVAHHYSGSTTLAELWI